jgi:hypothetical protein
MDIRENMTDREINTTAYKRAIIVMASLFDQTRNAGRTRIAHSKALDPAEDFLFCRFPLIEFTGISPNIEVTGPANQRVLEWKSCDAGSR